MATHIISLGLMSSTGCSPGKGKEPAQTPSSPPSQHQSIELVHRTKPLAVGNHPALPKSLILKTSDEILALLESYPVATQGLLCMLSPQFAGVLEGITDKFEQINRVSAAKIKCQDDYIIKVEDQISVLIHNMDQEPTLSSEDMIANAAREVTIETLQDQLAQSKHDYEQILNERAAVCKEIDNIRANYGHTFSQKDQEASGLRSEVTRLLNKNMLETLQYNDLLQDHLDLQSQLARAKERISFLDDAAVAQEAGIEELAQPGRSLRSKAAKNTKVAEQQHYKSELKEAKKEVQDISNELDAVVAEKETKFRALRDEHLNLKRKYEDLTAELPIRLAGQESANQEKKEPAPKKRKTKASASTSAPAPVPSKLSINIKVFTLNSEGTIAMHAYLHSLDSANFPSYDLAGLRTTAWNLLRSSYNGANICDNVNIDDTSLVVRVKGLPTARWETADDGGVKMWWIAVKGVAAAFEEGLLGEIDVLFVMGAVEGSSWKVERSLRLADGFGNGDGFTCVDQDQWAGT